MKQVALSINDDIVVHDVNEGTPILLSRVQSSCPECGETPEELRAFFRTGWGKFNEFRKEWWLMMLEPCGHFVSRLTYSMEASRLTIDAYKAPESYIHEWTHIASREGGWPQEP